VLLLGGIGAAEQGAEGDAGGPHQAGGIRRQGRKIRWRRRGAQRGRHLASGVSGAEGGAGGEVIGTGAAAFQQQIHHLLQARLEQMGGLVDRAEKR
jgi:hypothetical protein